MLKVANLILLITRRFAIVLSGAFERGGATAPKGRIT